MSKSKMTIEDLAVIIEKTVAKKEDIQSLKIDIQSLEERLTYKIESVEKRLSSEIRITNLNVKSLQDDMKQFATKAEVKRLEKRFMA